MANPGMTIEELYGKLKETQEKQTQIVLEELKNNQAIIHEKIEKIEKQVQELQLQYLTLERKSRKNNIVIFGLETSKDNLLNDTLQKLNNLMHISLTRSDVNNIYTVGKEEDKQGILVQFTNYFAKQEVFKNVGELKNQDQKISIVNDLCVQDQKTHKKLIKHLKEAKEKNQKARIVGHKLEINGETFSAEELDLESENDSDDEENKIEKKGKNETGGETKKKNQRPKKKNTKKP